MHRSHYRHVLAGTLGALLTTVISSSAVAAEFTRLAAALPETGEVHLGLFNGEEPDGFMRLGWYREGGDIVLFDRTMMPSAEVYETLEARLSGADLAPRSVSIRFHQGTAVMNIDAAFDEGKVSGRRALEVPGQDPKAREFEHSLEDSAQLRAVSFLLPLVLDRAAGNSLSYTWYGPLGDKVESVRLSARDGGRIETPAGAFDTVCFELRGGTPENDIYVSLGDEPRIVRIDVLGQPLKFLALPEPASQGAAGS